MKLREFLIGTAIMSFALATANPGLAVVVMDDLDEPIDEKSRGPVGAPVPSPLLSKDEKLRAAYQDALEILASNNQCSDFFGGPGVVEIFNQLISKARKGRYPKSVGMRLSGITVSVYDIPTKKTYRLFEELSINENGPFYRQRSSTGEPMVPWVGNFGPNTREVRVLMLLHELGHLVKGPDGQWLLVNDGNDESLSSSNTRKIEAVCRDQIKNLSKARTAGDSTTADR